MIPRVVYQTWCSKSEIPQQYKDALQHNKNLNPEYEFKLYDDYDLENLFLNAPEALRNTFFRINPKYGAARADLFRYYIIWTLGGIYMDIKIRCKKPFREWIYPEDECLLSYWEGLWYQRNVLQNKKGELQNWFLIFAKGHYFLEKVMETICLGVENNPFLHNISGKEGVLSSTGPLIYTRSIESSLEGSPRHRFIDSSLYLDYGPSFSGIPGYPHYSTLQEPVFLNSI
jgi:mannosyltransferase OCH1-like enzyme